MGVFARLFRRSKAAESRATEEAPIAEEPADAATTGSKTPAVGSEADGTAAAKGSAGADGGAGGGTAKPPQAEDARADGDGVDIPRQQSTDEVAEQEAGEGART